MSNRCTICGAEVDYAEETAHRFVDHDPSPLTEDIVAYVRVMAAEKIRAFADDNQVHVETRTGLCSPLDGDRCDITAAYRHAASIVLGDQ